MKTRALLLFATILFANYAYSQCDEVARSSEKYFDKEYVSDGQTYRALLVDDQVAEFTTLFFGGSTYRLSANTGTEKGIVFTVRDQNRNVLFSSSDFENAPYWDFVVENTLDCTIEAHLDPAVQNSGCAVILIGFKE